MRNDSAFLHFEDVILKEAEQRTRLRKRLFAAVTCAAWGGGSHESCNETSNEWQSSAARVVGRYGDGL